MAANDNFDEGLTSEEDLIRHYFRQGFQYQEMLEKLRKFRDTQMSIATLKRRIKSY